jgi:tRNA threonylcarbamoyladenosine biosynthesis protein TsaB
MKDKKYYLYLNTSEPEAEVAIYQSSEDDLKLLKEIKWLAHWELSATLSKKIKELLRESKISKNDLAGILVFPGPGSFTGLRIGISFANAFAFGLSIPLYVIENKNKMVIKNPTEIVLPLYGSEPKITTPKTK